MAELPVQLPTAAMNATHHSYYGLWSFSPSPLLSLKAWGLHQYGDFSFDNGALDMMALAWPTIASLVLGYVTMVLAFQPKQTTNGSTSTRRLSISPHHLSSIRQAWNALLALYSILGATHMGLYLIRQLFTNGLYAILCYPDPSYYNGPIGFWYLLFCLGKIVELGDTVLLLASSNRPIMLLHWFHHATVLPCTWYGVQAQIPMFRVVTTINYTVHAIMYSYFYTASTTTSSDVETRRSMQQRGQRITMMQCTQFVLDLVAIAVGLYDKVVYDNPSISYLSVVLSSTVIGSYLVLFLQFADDKYGWYSQIRHVLWLCKRKHLEQVDSASSNADECSVKQLLPWHRSDLTLERRFHEATKRAALLSDVATPSDLLTLYACFKQVQCGPIAESLLNNSSEQLLDPRDRAKRQAWSTMRHVTTDEARQQYMDLMDVLHDRSLQQTTSSIQKHRKPLVDVNMNNNMNADPFVLYPVRIVGHGTCLPQRIVTNDEIAQRGGFSSQETKRTGVKERRFCNLEGGENLVQNGAQAIRNACAKAGLSVDDLDMIVGGFGGHQFLPDDACLVQRELGLGTSGTRAFTVHATCLSFVVAMEVAGSLMREGRYHTVAVFASSIASVGIFPEDAHTAGLFGDGAAAVILQPSPEGSEAAIHAVQMETYGVGADACRILGGGTYRHHDNPESTHRMGYFEMDGPQTLALASQYARLGVRRFLPGLENGLQKLQFPGHDRTFDIDWIVPHQASAVGLDSLSLYGWPESRILKTIHKYGNTIAASIPLTLCDGIDSGKIKKGDKLLLCGTSAGLSVGFMLITY